MPRAYLVKQDWYTPPGSWRPVAVFRVTIIAAADWLVVIEHAGVDWIQAANGKKNTVRTKMRAIVFRDQPNPNMIRRFEPS